MKMSGYILWFLEQMTDEQMDFELHFPSDIFLIESRRKYCDFSMNSARKKFYNEQSPKNVWQYFYLTDSYRYLRKQYSRNKYMYIVYVYIQIYIYNIT